MKAWDSEKVFHDGDRFFSDIERAVLSAKKSVEIEIYIFNLDAFGLRFVSLLKVVASRGIEVHLLVDGFGSLSWDQALIKDLQSYGIQARIYHPIPEWLMGFFLPWNIWRFLRWEKFLKMLWKLNRRNHRKVFLIDEEIAYVGSFNIAAFHLAEFSGSDAWRDSGVRVEGSSVKQIARALHKNWKTSKSDLHGFKSPLVKLNDTWSYRRKYRHELVRRVSLAKERIWIMSPYFVPDFHFLWALRRAAYAGVDVRVVLPKKNDIFLMKFANQASYRFLLRAGVRIFEYLPTTLHAKVLLIDEWVALGSSNRNHRSLIHDLEIDLVLTHPTSLSSIENRFLEDLRQSEEIHRSAWASPTWLQFLLHKMIRSFKKWL